MKKETLERLIREHDSQDSLARYGRADLAGYIASVLEEEKALTKRLRSIAQDQRDEIERHAGEVKRLRKAMDDLRSECPHHETTYHGDPSGGSDKSDICDLCGADVRELRRAKE